MLIGFLGGSNDKESASNAGDLVWSLGWEDSPEKGMATHSSILAWEIPWTKEPGRLRSTGSQKSRQDWATNTFTFIMFIINIGEISSFSHHPTSTPKLRLVQHPAEGSIRKPGWAFPDGPAWKTPCFTAGGMSSIPGQGTKIPHAAFHGGPPIPKKEGQALSRSTISSHSVGGQSWPAPALSASTPMWARVYLTLYIQVISESPLVPWGLGFWAGKAASPQETTVFVSKHVPKPCAQLVVLLPIKNAPKASLR